MKKLNIGQLVYLENEREYTVVSSIEKNNNNYVYLITTDQPYIITFAKAIWHNENLDLELITNQREKEELLELFSQEIKNI